MSRALLSDSAPPSYGVTQGLPNLSPYARCHSASGRRPLTPSQQLGSFLVRPWPSSSQANQQPNRRHPGGGAAWAARRQVLCWPLLLPDRRATDRPWPASDVGRPHVAVGLVNPYSVYLLMFFFFPGPLRSMRRHWPLDVASPHARSKTKFTTARYPTLCQRTGASWFAPVAVPAT